MASTQPVYFMFFLAVSMTVSPVAGDVTRDSVRRSLAAELTNKLRDSSSDDRLNQLKSELRTMYTALPKNEEGHLEHSVVRYALHRLMVQRHGWYIKGLEPDRGNATGMQSLKEWVPSYIQDLLEQRTGGHGFDLAELVAFTATLEDLVHNEAVDRLSSTYKTLEMDTASALRGEQAEDVMHTYLMAYLLAGDFNASSKHEAMMKLGKFKREYDGWREVEQWADELQTQVVQTSKAIANLDFATSTRVVEEIGLQFGSFNDGECRELKSTLLGIEDKKQGRVTLAEFYKMGLHTHWAFVEKIDYLRTLGALDESNPKQPAVIVPNYLSSRPQCLEASSFYAVCCRNECEDLMTSVEQTIAEPTATFTQVVEVISTLTSDTVREQRQLSSSLLLRLQQIANTHAGKIPIHGRLFAQWMHHAFPRECPFPHEVGTTSPQTPDEWMQKTGHSSTQATEEEMLAHCSASPEESADNSDELPWTDAEELLVKPVIAAESVSIAASKENASRSEFDIVEHLSPEEIADKVLDELTVEMEKGAADERFSRLEKELKHTFAALPKNAVGKLDRDTARYALHRLLIQSHGWYLKGLEPITNTDKDWVPAYLEEVLERHAGGQGVDLQELIALAATLEDLIHAEARRRLTLVYQNLGMSNGTVVSGDEADNLIDTYLMVYLLGGDFSASSPHDAMAKLGRFKKNYDGWREVDQWAREIQKSVIGSSSTMQFTQSSRVVEQIGLQFGTYNDMECRDLKSTLLGVEDQKHGRVKLAEFYRMGLHTHWAFTEKVDYLRALGALDESDPSDPSIIVPNYVGSRPQCLEASGFYAVCCRNECEDLMDHLEREIQAPSADPFRLAELVEQLSSDTVTAPRRLAVTQMAKLQEIADASGGMVSLHGRAFAQWMHHAYPRECPLPHASSIGPQTPDEWMASTGQDTQASEEEMVCLVNGRCSVVASAAQADRPESPEETPARIPTSHNETQVHRKKAHWTEWLQPFNTFVRTLALSGAAVGLVLASKVGVPTASCDPAAKTNQRKDASWWVTVAMFVLPLMAISVDYLFDVTSSNELLLCLLSWAMAAMVIFQLVRYGQPIRDVLRNLMPKRNKKLDECWV